jgi:hypothetical protein
VVKWSRIGYVARGECPDVADHNPACERYVGDSETDHVKSERIDRAVVRIKGIELIELNKREGKKSREERAKRKNRERGIG